MCVCAGGGAGGGEGVVGGTYPALLRILVLGIVEMNPG